ncbi:MAG TPA: enoyl-CoA hydratase-related protein, partial [Haliangiales bacterium]|nr:enoyl-CoA hydratase-related protein [Haliangiales bacterium]
MTYVTIRYEDADAPIARIVLNQPERRNPIGPLTCGELIHALGRAGADERVRCVIVTGAGKVFSAGGDLGHMQGKDAGA